MATAISFNGYDLQNANIITNTIRHEGMAERQFEIENLTTREGFELLDTSFRRRIIRVSGTLVADSEQALDTLLDELKYQLRVVDGTLDIGFDNTTRRYTGTVQNLDVPSEAHHITHVPYVIDFVCQPIGFDPALESIGQANITTSPWTAEYTLSGGYNPLPVLYIDVNSETDMTAIEVASNVTGDSITVIQAFAANDALIINTEEKSVLYNGAESEYTGIFPLFRGVVSDRITITTTSTAHDFDLTIEYNKRYL